MKFNIPKTLGFKSGKIWFVIALVIIVGVGLFITAVFQNPMGGGGASFSGLSQEESKPTDQPTRQNTDSDIDGILMAEHQKSIEKQNESDDVEDKVPSVTDGGSSGNSSSAKQPGYEGQSTVDPSADELAKQIQQIHNQQKLERLTDHYASYSAKINVFNGKGNTSDSSSNSSFPPTDKALLPASENKQSNTGATQSLDPNSVYSSARIQKPFSPYELKAGSVINCVLQTRIVSQLDGQVTCMVNENVYDSTNGKYLLIPQGGKLIGNYSHNVPIGNDRLAVAFRRLIYPNGNSIILENIPGSDSTGANGVSDEVDNHYWQLYGSSFILGVIKYAGNQASTSEGIGGTTGQEMTNTAGQQMQQTINVAPTITIREGFRISIVIDKDLILEPYQE